MANRRAIAIIAVAVCLDAASGAAFSATEHISLGMGLYWAVSTVTTVGYGDVTPHTTFGHVLAALVMLTLIPLVAAAYSLITSGITARHVRREGESLRNRLDHIIFHHPSIPPLEED